MHHPPQSDTYTVKDAYSYEEVLSIMEYLRSEQGCPWDRKQTHASLRSNLIEEAYEVVDAIDSEQPERLQDELGDLLLQVIFHAQMAEERGEFDMAAVLSGLGHKLVSRHTHIFGQDRVSDAEEALGVWDQNKKIEKGFRSESDALRDVPRYLPTLSRAYKLQKKAAGAGFDWPDDQGAWAKVHEEEAELKEALQQGKRAQIEEEAGDLLFALVNVLRLNHLDPELMLAKANDKFLGRFTAMEALAEADGQALKELDLAAMDAYWDRAKALERTGQAEEI